MITEAEARALAEHIGIKLGLAKDGEEAPVETAARAILGWFAARPVLTEEAAKLRRLLFAVDATRMMSHARGQDFLIHADVYAEQREALDDLLSFDGTGEFSSHVAALLLRVAGPVTAEQASMAAAFDAAKGGAS